MTEQHLLMLHLLLISICWTPMLWLHRWKMMCLGQRDLCLRPASRLLTLPAARTRNKWKSAQLTTDFMVTMVGLW